MIWFTQLDWGVDRQTRLLAPDAARLTYRGRTNGIAVAIYPLVHPL